jgi:hypothetical protein
MLIPDPDFYPSQIEPSKEEGEKTLFVLPFLLPKKS